MSRVILETSFVPLFGTYDMFMERRAIVFACRVVPEHYRFGYDDRQADVYRPVKQHFIIPTMFPNYDIELIACPVSNLDKRHITFIDFIFNDGRDSCTYVRRSTERANPYDDNETQSSMWVIERDRADDDDDIMEEIRTENEEVNTQQKHLSSNEHARCGGDFVDQVAFIANIFQGHQSGDGELDDDELTNCGEKQYGSTVRGHTLGNDRIENTTATTTNQALLTNCRDPNRAVWAHPTYDGWFCTPLWVDRRHWELVNDQYTVVASPENSPIIEKFVTTLNSLSRLRSAIRTLQDRCYDGSGDVQQWPPAATTAMDRFGSCAWSTPATPGQPTGLTRAVDALSRCVVVDEWIDWFLFRPVLDKLYRSYREPVVEVEVMDVNDAAAMIIYRDAFPKENGDWWRSSNGRPIDLMRFEPYLRVMGIRRHPLAHVPGSAISLNKRVQHATYCVDTSTHKIRWRSETLVDGTVLDDGAANERNWSDAFSRYANSIESLEGEVHRFMGNNEAKDAIVYGLTNELCRAFDMLDTFIHVTENARIYVTHPLLPPQTCFEYELGRLKHNDLTALAFIHRSRLE